MSKTTSWSLKELSEHLTKDRKKIKDNVYALDLINSLSRSHDIFLYHVLLARDATKGIFKEGDSTGVEGVKLIFGVSDNDVAYRRALVVSEANLLGCIYAVRSLLDIFAQLVNELALKPKLAVKKVDIMEVIENLAPSKLKTELDKLKASSEFRYVTRFVNTTKHRQLVPHVTAVDFEKDATELQVGKVEFNGETFKARSVHKALDDVIALKNHFVKAGKLLNKQVVHGEV
jgi:hypothetical protein